MSEADGLVRLRQPIGVTYNWSAGPNATSQQEVPQLFVGVFPAAQRCVSEVRKDFGGRC
ncbi:MAG: hypothetical protein RL628_508 [Actinomycetota bacterium]